MSLLVKIIGVLLICVSVILLSVSIYGLFFVDNAGVQYFRDQPGRIEGQLFAYSLPLIIGSWLVIRKSDKKPDDVKPQFA